MKKSLFVIDGAGALFSAFLLGVVLVQFQTAIGMPVVILYPLAVAACVLALYSFICHFMFSADPDPYLKIISILNVLYACVTGVLVICFFEQITLLGLFYFGLELAIILALARFEYKVAAGKKRDFA